MKITEINVKGILPFRFLHWVYVYESLKLIHETLVTSVSFNLQVDSHTVFEAINSMKQTFPDISIILFKYHSFYLSS